MAYIPKNYARLKWVTAKRRSLSPGVRTLLTGVCLLQSARADGAPHRSRPPNNPEDGSNWEMLCLYCHDHEHSKYTEADQYGSTVVAGEDAQRASARPPTTRLPI